MGWFSNVDKKITHLRASNSAPAMSVFKRALTIFPDYYLGKGRSGRLVNITFESTYRCNLRCDFCFLRGNRLNRRDEELTLEEIAGMADQARKLQCSIYITGGEPFLRKDGVEIVETIKARGVKCGVNTNATLLDEEKAARLAAAGMDYVIASIHGGEEYHDATVGKKGSRARAAKALKDLRAASDRMHILVNFVLTDQSADQVRHVIDLCAEVGATALTVQHLTFLTQRDVEAHERVWPRYFGDEQVGLVCSLVDPDGCDTDRLLKAAADAKEYANSKGVLCIVKPDLNKETLDIWYSKDYSVESRCLYPWTDTRVAPNGEVYVCQFIPYPVGNIREEPLSELLNNERYRKFRVALKEARGQFPACARCCKLYRGGLKPSTNSKGHRGERP